MGSFEIQDEDADAVRGNLINHMGKVHKMVDDGCQLFFERYRRKTYVTPRSYLGFISLYREVYVKKVAHVEELASSINSGLEKLEQASADVSMPFLGGEVLACAQCAPSCRGGSVERFWPHGIIDSESSLLSVSEAQSPQPLLSHPPSLMFMIYRS